MSYRSVDATGRNVLVRGDLGDSLNAFKLGTKCISQHSPMFQTYFLSRTSLKVNDKNYRNAPMMIKNNSSVFKICVLQISTNISCSCVMLFEYTEAIGIKEALS